MSILMGVVTFRSVLQAIVIPGSFMPLIGSIVTWAPLSAIPTSKLSITLEPIASIFLVPTRSAIPLLNDWRGLRKVFELFLVLFVKKLKLNIQKTRIMASSLITSWQIDGETVKTVADFILGGSKITADGDCSHEIKRCLLLGRKVMTNLDSILKRRDMTLPTNVHIVKATVFPGVMCGCESWTIKKAECRRIDALELWCWRRLLRVPWTARRSNQSILKEIRPECSLEGLMLKVKLQYFGHLMQRAD